MSSFTINRVVLVGRLTRDPELRSLSSGSKVCNLRIACSSVRRDPDGEYQEKPNYFDVDVFGNQAESVKKYTRKGTRVGIDGRLEWREWETHDKQKRQMVNIVADTVVFLDGADERQTGEREQDDFLDAEARLGGGEDELSEIGGKLEDERLRFAV